MRSHRTTLSPRAWSRMRGGIAALTTPGDAATLSAPPTLAPTRRDGAASADTARIERALEQALRSGDHSAQRFLQTLAAMTERLLAAATEEEAFAVVAEAGPKLFPGWAGRLTRPGVASRALAEWREPASLRPPDAAASLHTLRVCVPPSAAGGAAAAAAARRLDLQLDRSSAVPAHWLGLVSCGAQAFAAALDLALTSLRMRLALQDQAMRDELTGLHNRRFFNDALAHEVARSQRDGSALSLAILDIDHFKAFNDEYGHPAGDAVLRAVGRAVQQAVRRSDIACRIGGEEIALLLPHSPAEGATGHLEALCRRIASLEVCFEGRRLPPVTVSIGIAQARGRQIDATALIQRADDALYAAKHEGRNRVVAWKAPQDGAAG